MSKRLRSQLVWDRVSVPATMAVAKGVTESETEVPTFPIDLAPRDQAIALLLIGAEVEHALMVQYLYGAYSLDEEQPDEATRQLVRHWRSVILEIAREEMGHLATVQNLLTVIGGPLSFDREDYPIIDPELWPFPFQLEPLTKKSLAKYVLAEMPSQQVLKRLHLEKEIDAIVKYVEVDCLHVHRVGLIYDRITSFFTKGPIIEGPNISPFTDTHPYIATIDIQAAKVKFQATPDSWGLGNQRILVKTAFDRDSAIKAVQLVSTQGEGSDIESDLEKSHFGRFLKIYRQFPDDRRVSRNIATNPTTNPRNADRDRQIEGSARPWAELCNLRYRMLLTYLLHSFYVEARTDETSRFPGAALISWAFGEMYNIRSFSEILMRMPLQTGTDLRAGPPFEMPYSLALPHHSDDRWRMHRDLLLASISMLGEMVSESGSHETFLRALRTADETALQQINALIGA